MARGIQRNASNATSASRNTPSSRKRLPIPVTPQSNGANSSGSSSISVSVTPRSSRSSSPLTPRSNQSPLSQRSTSPSSPQTCSDKEVERNLSDDRLRVEPSMEATSLEEFITEQRSFNDKVLRILSQTKDQSRSASSGKERLPLKLTEAVRGVYKEMEEAAEFDDGNEVKVWNLEQSFAAEENEAVHAAIIRGVRSTEKNYSSAQLRAAIRCHFKTRKRRWTMKKQKTSQAYKKSQRARSRINTKRLQRLKSLKDSTSISEEAKQKMQSILINNAYISSDESISDSSDRENAVSDDSDEESPAQPACKKVLVIKKLPWRHPDIASTFRKLDRRTGRERSQKGQSMMLERREGPASSRRAPVDAPAWALA